MKIVSVLRLAIFLSLVANLLAEQTQVSESLAGKLAFENSQILSSGQVVVSYLVLSPGAESGMKDPNDKGSLTTSQEKLLGAEMIVEYIMLLESAVTRNQFFVFYCDSATSTWKEVVDAITRLKHIMRLRGGDLVFCVDAKAPHDWRRVKPLLVKPGAGDGAFRIEFANSQNLIITGLDEISGAAGKLAEYSPNGICMLIWDGQFYAPRFDASITGRTSASPIPLGVRALGIELEKLEIPLYIPARNMPNTDLNLLGSKLDFR